MKKNFWIYCCLFIFSSCTTTITSYNIKNVQYPEWMLRYEFSRNYLGLQYNKNKSDDYTFCSDEFFIENNATFGNKNTELRLLIDPEKDFSNLNIIEISYERNNEKIILYQNIKIPNNERRYKPLPELKYNNYYKYFKNFKEGEKEEILLMQKYQFDDDPVISMISPYIIYCFSEEYSPFDKYASLFDR